MPNKGGHLKLVLGLCLGKELRVMSVALKRWGAEAKGPEEQVKGLRGLRGISALVFIEEGKTKALTYYFSGPDWTDLMIEY